MGSGRRNESNSDELARIDKNKIFHELDVHRVHKVGFKRLWALEAEMSLTAMNLLQSAREENFLRTRRTSGLKSRIQTFLLSGGRNESNSHVLAGIGPRRIFFISTRRTSCVKT